MKRLLIVLLAITLVAGIKPIYAIAQEEGLEYLLFEEIPAVSIAAKQEESLLSASGTVYVITDKDIERYGWRDMKEILNAVPNMDVMWQYNWLNGGQRGFTGNFSGTLLLIDGREVQNLLASEAFITNDFPAHRIKRVEILQGPNSTLYGGNAAQGVINIVTKFGDQGDTDLNEVEVIYGDVDTEQIAGVFKKKTENAELGFSGSYFKSNQNWTELAEFAGNDELYSRNPDIDNLRYKGTEQFRNDEEAWTADAYVRYQNIYAGYNYFNEINRAGIEYVTYDYSGTEPRRGYRQAFMGYKHTVSDTLNGFIEYKNVLETERWFNQSYVSGTSYADIVLETTGETIDETKRNSIEMELNYQPNDTNSIVAGYEWWELQLDDYYVAANTIYPNRTPANLSAGWPLDKLKVVKHSVFVQDTINIVDEKLKVTLGLRYNKQDFTNDSYLPRISAVYMLTKNDAIKFTYGKAFRPPNVFEFIGAIEDSLESQEMEMYELNYSKNITLGEVQISNILALYQMEASNLYNKVAATNAESSSGQLGTWKTVVSGKFKITGIEDFVRFQYKKLSGLAGFRWINPDDTLVAGEEITKDVPKTKVKLGLSYQILDHLSAAIFIDHFAKVKTEANTIDGTSTEIYEVPSFTVANLNINIGEFELEDGMSAMFSIYIENLLDKTYYHANVRGTTPIQFLQPPRTIRAKATLKF